MKKLRCVSGHNLHDGQFAFLICWLPSEGGFIPVWACVSCRIVMCMEEIEEAGRNGTLEMF